MHAVQRAIRAARARLFRQAWLSATGVLTLGAMAACAALLVIDRALALRLPMMWIAAVLAAGVLLAAPIFAMARRRGDEEIATLLDQRLGLHDRLATALYAGSLGDDPLAAQVIDEAERAAQRAPVAVAVPVGFSRVWRFVPLALLALVVLLWFMPGTMDLLGLQAKRDAEAARISQQRAAEREVEEAKEMMRRAQERQKGDQKEAEKLPQLAKLTEKDLSTPQGRRDAAAELAEAADKLGAEAQRKKEEADAQKNMLSRLEKREYGPANSFASDLRRGDVEAASQSLKDLSDTVEQMPPDEKQKLADQLQDMAKQLDAQSKQQAQKQQEAQKDAREQLKQRGLNDQQIDKLAQQNHDAKAVEQALKEKGADPQQAKQTAKNVQQQQKLAQDAQKNKESSEKLSTALKGMAQSATDKGQAQAPAQQGQKPQQSSPQGGSQQGPSQQPSPQQQGDKTQGASQQPSPKPGDKGQGGPQPSASGQQPQQQGEGAFQQAAKDAQQQLQRMAQPGQQAQELAKSQQQVQQAMRRLSSEPSKSGDGSQKVANSSGHPGTPGGGGVGGKNFGLGGGSAPLGPPKEFKPTNTHAENVASTPVDSNKVIASWDAGGKVAKGEATVAYDLAVTAAKEQSEQAISEDRVPRRYHEGVREYFQQIPSGNDK